jgi:hypothetical protein
MIDREGWTSTRAAPSASAAADFMMVAWLSWMRRDGKSAGLGRRAAVCG